jgi:hypothetical protein
MTPAHGQTPLGVPVHWRGTLLPIASYNAALRRSIGAAIDNKIISDTTHHANRKKERRNALMHVVFIACGRTTTTPLSRPPTGEPCSGFFWKLGVQM